MQIASITEAQTHLAAPLLAPLVLPAASRARSLMDASRTSATYGCADRGYWYYRTLTNFPGATWQQVMLGHAALYASESEGDPELLEASAAALSFWSRMGHRDGAYDEWYQNEHSYCPTAINGAGAALTLHLLGGKLYAARRSEAVVALRQTGTWLDGRYNATVMNQNLAAAVALIGLARADDNAPRWRERAAAKLMRVRTDQSSEGWFPEYEGADLGYSTLALDLLAAYHKLSGAEIALEMAQKLSAFLVRVQGGWRALGGRLGSRGTSHVFPFGALYFAGHDANAAQLASAWMEGLSKGLAPAPLEVDDRYFAYFYFPQFALAYHHAATSPHRLTTATAKARGEFAQSGFVAIDRGSWSALVSRRLGGALALSNAAGEITYHCGYEVAAANGQRFSSAVWDKQQAFAVAGSEDAVTVSARFKTASSGIPLKKLMAPFQLTVGMLGSSRLAEAFQSVVKSRMIAPAGALPLHLERRIETDANGMRVRDTLTPKQGLPQLRIVDVTRAVSMHSPSARQDRARVVDPGGPALARVCAELDAGRSATLTFRIDGESGDAVLESVT